MIDNVKSSSQLRQFIERIERLEEEKKNIQEDIKNIFAEAKFNGYDAKIMRQVIKIRKMDSNDFAEQEALIDAYLNEVGQ